MERKEKEKDRRMNRGGINGEQMTGRIIRKKRIRETVKREDIKR